VRSFKEQTKLFCPKCASQNVDGASFCRACGANISLVPQALSGQIAPANQPPVDEYLSRRYRRRESGIDSAVRSLTMGVAFAVVAMLVGKFGPGGSAWWFWLLIPAAVMIARGLSDVIRCRLNKARTPSVQQPQLNTLRQPDLPAPKTGELLTAVPSVTEGTTRHLGAEAQTQHLDSYQNQRPS
jgi:zinc-ribbon domain